MSRYWGGRLNRRVEGAEGWHPAPTGTWHYFEDEHTACGIGWRPGSRDAACIARALERGFVAGLACRNCQASRAARGMERVPGLAAIWMQQGYPGSRSIQ